MIDFSIISIMIMSASFDASLQLLLQTITINSHGGTQKMS